MKEINILIVDDAPENIALLGELLSDYSLKIATSGEKALKIVHSGAKVDVILLDIVMPGLDGFEVAKTLKSNPETMSIPIIFITAQTDIDSFIKGFDLGADEYITKPFDGEQVRNLIRSKF